MYESVMRAIEKYKKEDFKKNISVMYRKNGRVTYGKEGV
jgi:hypothetical protein